MVNPSKSKTPQNLFFRATSLLSTIINRCFAFLMNHFLPLDFPPDFVGHHERIVVYKRSGKTFCQQHVQLQQDATY